MRKPQQVLFICNSCNKKQYRMSDKHKGIVFEICRRCSPLKRTPKVNDPKNNDGKSVSVKTSESSKSK